MSAESMGVGFDPDGKSIIVLADLALDLEHDGQIARVAEVPESLKAVGIHDGDQISQFDGESGYQKLKRDEVRFGVPLTIEFTSGSKITTVQVLFTATEHKRASIAAAPVAAPLDLIESDVSAAAADSQALVAEFQNYFAVTPAPAREEAAIEPPPRLPDDQTPFGPRDQPNVPEQDLRFFESIRQRREEAPYDPFAMPDGPPPSHWWVY